MGVTWDFDAKDLESQLKNEVKLKLDEIGRSAVEYAKEHGNYRDRTGHLRASNQYHASEDGLVLENTAEYASKVEARGYDVITGAILHTMKELEK